MLEKLMNEFDIYTDNYDKNKMEISVKYKHSYTVMNLMGILANELHLTDKQIYIAKVIGLLHDIGRFEQFKRFNSFSDKNIDHADMSCVYLFDEGHIRDFIDDKSFDKIIEIAIKYHNKLNIPDGLNSEEELFLKMIRDMDKVDIYKQISTHYEYHFNANEVSEEVLKYFKEEKPIPITIRKSKSDSVLVMLGFIFDINFDESFDILVDTDNFDLFISTIDVDSNSEKLWRKIRELCYDKINRGINR